MIKATLTLLGQPKVPFQDADLIRTFRTLESGMEREKEKNKGGKKSSLGPK